jgi:hypothetical protein
MEGHLMAARTAGRLGLALGLGLVLAAFCVAGLTAATGQSAGTAPAAGSTNGVSGPTGTDSFVQQFETDPAAAEDDQGDTVVDRARPGFHTGKFPPKPLSAPAVGTSTVSNPGGELNLSFTGMNHRDQRLANGGNQFSLEPPDQGLCAGNGRVIEDINDVIRIYDTSGNPLSGVVDLNTFFGYPAAINRTTLAFGPEVTDPTCLYDAEANRWIVQVLTLDRVGTSQTLSGVNHLDIAISPNGSPSSLSGWTIYRIDVTDDGTNGTPNHGCTSGVTAPRHPGAAIGDYPKIASNADGIYLMTNEYCFFGDGYNGSQIYAIGNKQFSGPTLPSSLGFVHVENTSVDGSPGFTVWPAQSVPGQYATGNGGTEYFVSTVAGDGSETGNPTGTARRLGLWALTNTSSLNTSSPSVTMTSRLINSEDYVFPPHANQKLADWPLGQCINDTSIQVAPNLFGCWRLLLATEPAHTEVPASPDANDTRIQQVWYSNGQLYAAADTAVNVGGQIKAGVAWFVISPKINGAGKVEGQVKSQGYLALANNNLTYPAWAVLPNGTGAMAFTVLGGDYFPSAGYALWDGNGFGDIHLAGQGVGMQDGFTGYAAEVAPNPVRPRWGDYGAAVPVGNSIWIASEWIGQSCNLATYVATGGACGNTRTSLANWSTRISKVTP